MIHTIRTVAVGDQESKIDSPIILYRGDREVEVEFTINGSKFTFTNGGNVIESTNATHGQLVINTPTGENMFSEVTECHDGKVVFVITKEMIDELIEVGFYSFQIRLFDESQVSRVTIPPVLKGIDIRNPIAAEDETNVVDIGLVDYAVVVKDEFEDLSTFLPDGNYNKTEWESKDVISGAKLNKIEDALYNINSNMEATDLSLLNRVENINKNVYGEIYKLGNELESEVEGFERDLKNNIEIFKGDLTEELEHIEKNINLTPDDFEGSDIEKLQFALDYALENNIRTIRLNRAYDLTGGVIHYNGGYGTPPTFKDGTLLKNDGGFMFSRQEDNNYSNSPLFFNVAFSGNSNHPCYIIDGDRMIRQNFKNCNFKNIALITTNGYIQSLRLDNCEMTMSPNIFINCAGSYDVNITNNRFEESHKTLIKCYSEYTDKFACNSMRITNNLIEGYVYETPIILSSSYGLIIANNYFEYNKGDIEFIRSTGMTILDGSVNNNSFFRTNGECHIKANGHNAYYLWLNNNSTDIRFEDGKSFAVGLIYDNIKNTYLNAGGRLMPQGTVCTSEGVSYSVFDNNGKCAIRINPRSNTNSDPLEMLGRNYLIGFSGTFGSSIYYRATFTGILSVGGNWDSVNSRTSRELTLTKISSTNMNGANGDKNLWSDSYVTTVFEGTGTNTIQTTTDSDIIITFTQIPYNANYTRAIVRNIDGLLSVGLSAEYYIQK